MSDEQIHTADGQTIDVADHPRDSGIVATGATVSQSQKENLGNYENCEPHASVRVEFRPAIKLDSPEAEDALGTKLAVLRRVVDDHIQQSIDRTKAGREMDK